MPTEQPPEVDVDEEGSPLHPEEGVLRSPREAQGAQSRPEPRKPAAVDLGEEAQCEDVFCETKTVDESPLMKLSPEDRERHLKSGASGGG